MDSNHFSFTNLVKIDFQNYQFYMSVSKSFQQFWLASYHYFYSKSQNLVVFRHFDIHQKTLMWMTLLICEYKLIIARAFSLIELFWPSVILFYVILLNANCWKNVLHIIIVQNGIVQGEHELIQIFSTIINIIIMHADWLMEWGILRAQADSTDMPMCVREREGGQRER